MLSLGDGRQTQGSSDYTPIVLADVHLADGDYKEITAEGFELAMRVIYPDMLMTNPPKGATEWKEVLEISRRWQSTHLRTTAITHLAKLKWNPSDRLTLAITYEVDEWMPDILRDLVIQRALVSPTDLLRLPRTLLPGFVTARERVRAEFLADAQSRSCTNTSKQVSCTWRPEHRRLIGQAIADALDSKPVSKPRTVFDRFMQRKDRLAICEMCTRLDALWIREWVKTAGSIVNQYCFSKEAAFVVDGASSGSYTTAAAYILHPRSPSQSTTGPHHSH
ncbi:hypothetical protein BS47DRAFT_342166 [Hydnum rufescens UP504]|uniref:BTB domain-containing protein n=1 Tax=Hydnum rufescens UP504 TaxID=1448309 RepID=A0A9P6AKB3_9AGAM|nr:hypothetical protein BS47DRAFT_342166 [Hydnum rufescens UP504]